MWLDGDMIRVLMLTDCSTANMNNMEIGFAQCYMYNPVGLLVSFGSGEGKEEGKIMNRGTMGKYSK